MKAIMVLFDTLNRRFLPPCGADDVHAPNFTRLAARSVQFENCYGGSMPCMPARRELHTARYNFLHRGWGPLEPFDDSVPAILSEAGVHTHLVTDHQHYWEDGGATYHPRFRTFEFFRGQEGDEWKGQVADPDMTNVDGYASNRELRRQDVINRAHMQTIAEHPQTLTFDAGLEFIETNRDEDGWFVQIETFDPHEPFFSYEQYHRLYDAPSEPAPGERDLDWPDYSPVSQSPAELAHLRDRYRALLSMCDDSLGRVLDVMDRDGLWEDTMLIVCTDHGLLLGEHDWLGKNVPPFYDETIHVPLFVWDPRSGVAGEKREQLVQTIDLGPTLLDLFDIEPTPDMQGQSVAAVIAAGSTVRETALFGIHGGHANITDGRHVYMRACVTADNQPLVDYTLMPTTMRGFLSAAHLRQAELVDPLPFTQGMPVLRVPVLAPTNPAAFGSMLFDLDADPTQTNPLVDDELELRMARLLVAAMRDNDAPPEQFVRLGLPETGDVTTEHLVLASQRAAAAPATTVDRTTLAVSPTANRSVRELLGDDEARAVLRDVLGPVVDGPLPPEAMDMSLLDIATVTVGMVPLEAVAAIAHALDRAPSRT